MKTLVSLLFATLIPAASVSAQYFSPATTQAMPTGVGAFKVTDMDADGDGDLLYFNDGSATLNNAVLVVINQGSIATSFFSFYLPVPAASSHSLDTADLENDGDQDIVSSNQTSFSVLRNDGTAITRIDYATAGARTRVLLSDMDGDGDEDVLLDAHEIFWNDGLGNFPTSSVIGVFTQPLQSPFVRTVDFDADGDQDILCAYAVLVQPSFLYMSGSANLWFASLRQDPGGVFTAVMNQQMSQDRAPVMMDIADLDQDADLDIVLGIGGAIGGVVPDSTSSVVIADVTAGVLNPISGQTTLSPVLPFGGRLRIGDIDADGTVDFVASGTTFTGAGNRTGVFALTSSGFVVRQMYGMVATPNYFALADFDGDQKPDIVAASGNAPFGQPSTSSIWTVRRNIAIPQPITLTKLSGDNQFVNRGAGTFPLPFSARLTDGNGLPLANREVYVPAVGITNGNSTGYLMGLDYMLTTNAAGTVNLSPSLNTLIGGAFPLLMSALDATVTFQGFIRSLSRTYYFSSGILIQNLLIEAANTPIVVAYDMPGYSTPTAYGTVLTGILSGPAPTTVIRDGLGYFAPPDPSMTTDATGNWFHTDIVPPPVLGSGFQIVIQAYALPIGTPVLVSNVVTVNL